MKRKNNLYNEICKIENIMSAYSEVCKNTKNKRKVNRYKEFKCINIFKIYNILTNKAYEVGKPFIFTIREPKVRRIVSQSMQDKVINHLVSRCILYPSIMPALIETNVASRENKGTSAGINYLKEYVRKCNIKYENYYILKCDITKFFQSIDHDILKEKIKRRIKDKDALNIVFKIIDSEKRGLSIGCMTSQVLAIFYLNDLDHYIKEKLKIKYYVRYQDDFLLLHKSKKYLKECLIKIEKFLEKEKLKINQKTRVYKSTDNFVFLGRTKNGKYSKYRTVKRKIKKRRYLYKNKKISLNGMMGTILNYKNLLAS